MVSQNREDFKVLLLGKPNSDPKVKFTESQGCRWYAQKQES